MNAWKNGDTSAFPTTESGSGMTLREYFAGQAMIGLLAGDESPVADFKDFRDQVASASVMYADALLEALEMPLTPPGKQG